MYPEKISVGAQTMPVTEFWQARKKELTLELLAVKTQLMHDHFEKVMRADAVLILNFDKNGVIGYIGGNTFLEMGMAFQTGKKIFMWKDAPRELPYYEEIAAMRPRVIHENISDVRDQLKISVGSKNNVKVDAVREIFLEYPLLAEAVITSMEVDSGVGNQPKSLEAAIVGAKNRARAAFVNCDLSVGLESGIMPVPHSRTGWMDFTACIIFDGQKTCLGLSSCFEYPKEVTRLLIEENMEASYAFRSAGLTDHERIGYAEGAIGILTNGRLTRKEYTKQALRTALIQLEHPELY